ncbi:hypothetical protein BBJ28_00002701 [Nothophytophthora sp. Chile5]|nr:hypothetical protein BBJ28_00002701 [Nothophytophthora sp. Chile5]
MFRSNWDQVSPFSWLDSLTGEEEFMRGFDEDFPSSHRLFPRPQRRRKQEDEPMAGVEEEEDEGGSLTAEGEEEKATTAMSMDFFADLPVGAKLMDTQVPPNLAPPETKAKEDYAFYTYSYSTCLTEDDKGRRVNSTRRRYEDSAGRLKALHKRQIGGCAMESTWKRSSEKDEGKHENKVTVGSVESFEEAWKTTPFGVAEEQAKAHGAKQQSVLPDQPPAKELP